MFEFDKELDALLESKVTDATLKAELKTQFDKLHATDIAKVKENKETILNEKREIKAKYDSLVTSTAGLDGKTAEDFKKLEDDIAKLRANPGDEEKVKQLEDTYKIRLTQAENDAKAREEIKNQELAEANETISGLNKAIDKDLCLRELNATLVYLGVMSKHLPLVKGFLSNYVYVKEVDGNKVVKYKGTTGPEFDLKEGLALWAKNEGKDYIGAPISHGAGGSGSGSAVSELVKLSYAEMSPEQRQTLYRDNKDSYEKKKAEYRRTR